MVLPPFQSLSHEEKDALIQRLAARITELEARLGRPRKTSSNSHLPPSQDGPGGKDSGKASKPRPRPSRPGVSRRLSLTPDRIERLLASCCPHCGVGVSAASQVLRRRYDHIDLPPIRPVTVQVELYGGRCGSCRKRYRAAAPEGMEPGSPFGPGIQALAAYLHHSHFVSFERLSRLSSEVFGLKISEGALSNLFVRMGAKLKESSALIAQKVLASPVIASDETTMRVNGQTHWHWVFRSAKAVVHQLHPRRAKAVAQDFLGGRQPEVWISDRYAGQQDLAAEHQVCLAHVLRDVQWAIDCGDQDFAPKLRDHLRWAIRVGRRRESLQDSTLKFYAGKAERGIDRLLKTPAEHPAGAILQRQVKAWRTKFFVFLKDRRVPPTNNGSEQEIRPTVTFRKVTNGFRSDWGGAVHAGYRSVTGTARLMGSTVFQAINDLVRGRFNLA